MGSIYALIVRRTNLLRVNSVAVRRGRGWRGVFSLAGLREKNGVSVNLSPLEVDCCIVILGCCEADVVSAGDGDDGALIWRQSTPLNIRLHALREQPSKHHLREM